MGPQDYTIPRVIHCLNTAFDLGNRKTHKHKCSVSRFPNAYVYNLAIPVPAVEHTNGVCFGLLFSWNPTCKPEVLAAGVTSSVCQSISFPCPV
jgi:hypothetical protein